MVAAECRMDAKSPGTTPTGTCCSRRPATARADDAWSRRRHEQERNLSSRLAGDFAARFCRLPHTCVVQYALTTSARSPPARSPRTRSPANRCKLRRAAQKADVHERTWSYSSLRWAASASPRSSATAILPPSSPPRTPSSRWPRFLADGLFTLRPRPRWRKNCHPKPAISQPAGRRSPGSGLVGNVDERWAASRRRRRRRAAERPRPAHPDRTADAARSLPKFAALPPPADAAAASTVVERVSFELIFFGRAARGALDDPTAAAVGAGAPRLARARAREILLARQLAALLAERGRRRGFLAAEDFTNKNRKPCRAPRAAARRAGRRAAGSALLTAAEHHLATRLVACPRRRRRAGGGAQRRRRRRCSAMRRSDDDEVRAAARDRVRRPRR